MFSEICSFDSKLSFVVCNVWFFFPIAILWFSLIDIFSIQQMVHGTKGHMVVYGPGCHPQNIIWTEAKLRSIYYFVGDWSINCHMALSAMNYLLLYTQYSDDMFFVIVYLRQKKRVRTKSGRKHYIDRARSIY